MSAVDPRLIQARDALDTAALHPVETLPPSVMARELAELRQVTAGLVGLVDEFPPVRRERCRAGRGQGHAARRRGRGASGPVMESCTAFVAH